MTLGENAATTRASTDGADPFVRFIDVQKTYDGEVLVVKGFNLDIQRGEFITLLGPSGSGKTTCLMMLAGFELPTQGDISIAGRSLRNLPPHRREIGVVFQNYALFPHMTVAENLAFPLEARRIAKPERKERVRRALEMVELDGFEGRRPGQLSGGQQQRVALARALVFEPQLVLMDEPLGALDKQLREQMQIRIKHIHEKVGVTVVYVTHDQSEALTLSDRIAVLKDGEIQQLGTPSEVYEEPQNAFVAQFVGENNSLSGRVLALDGARCRVALDGGGEVEGIPVGHSGAGLAASLSLRPESVTINPPEGSCPNSFDARVVELIYLGDHTRVRVSLCGRDDFVVKIPRTTHAPRLGVGETIRIGWQREDCRVFAAG